MRCAIRFVLLCLLGGVLGACGNDAGDAGSGAGGAEEAVLNVYNWSDYIGPDTLAAFERETGIKVNYDVFDANEVLEAKLLAGNTGYDIVVPSANFVARQIAAGLFQPLDPLKLPNYGNLDADILRALRTHDPQNAYVVPYMWGTTGIGYNVAMVRERLGDIALDTWQLLFEPDLTARLADCGVTLVDAPSEVFPAVLAYLGLPPARHAAGDIGAAEGVLAEVRPHLRYFHSSQYINDLASGEICVAFGWNGDILIARDRAREAGNGQVIDYVVPREGAPMWFDVLAIPKDAPHPDNAHRFIDFLLRPEVIAAITNAVNYANANAQATPLVAPSIAADPAIYPDAAMRRRLFPAAPTTPEHDRLVTRAWTRIKSGR
ncbi:MAG: polyamine ABC transporter substrate-binding protein [Gammaproteobacteria bacterium]